MSLGDAPSSLSKPRPPATRDARIVAVVYASVFVLTIVIALFTMPPGTSSVTSKPSSKDAPKLAQDQTHPSNKPPVVAANQLSPTTDSAAVRIVHDPDAELRARATSQMVELQQIGHDAGTALFEIENLIKTWEQQTNDLLANTEGRKLATRPSLVEQFAILTQQPNEILEESPRQTRSVTERERRPTLEAVKNWRKRLEAFMQLVKLPKNGASKMTMLSQDFKTDLQNLVTEISDSKSSLFEDLAILNQLSGEVRAADPGTKTLADALKDRNEYQRKRMSEARLRGMRAAELATERDIERMAQGLVAAEIQDSPHKIRRGRPGIVSSETRSKARKP